MTCSGSIITIFAKLTSSSITVVKEIRPEFRWYLGTTVTLGVFAAVIRIEIAIIMKTYSIGWEK